MVVGSPTPIVLRSKFFVLQLDFYEKSIVQSDLYELKVGNERSRYLSLGHGKDKIYILLGC